MTNEETETTDTSPRRLKDSWGKYPDFTKKNLPKRQASLTHLDSVRVGKHVTRRLEGSGFESYEKRIVIYSMEVNENKKVETYSDATLEGLMELVENSHTRLTYCRILDKIGVKTSDGTSAKNSVFTPSVSSTPSVLSARADFIASVRECVKYGYQSNGTQMSTIENARYKEIMSQGYLAEESLSKYVTDETGFDCKVSFVSFNCGRRYIPAEFASEYDAYCRSTESFSARIEVNDADGLPGNPEDHFHWRDLDIEIKHDGTLSIGTGSAHRSFSYYIVCGWVAKNRVALGETFLNPIVEFARSYYEHTTEMTETRQKFDREND